MVPRLLEQQKKRPSLLGEVLFLDSGSTDGSLAYLAQFPFVKVQSQIPFLGFGPQKQTAVGLAKFSWILSLDADEIPSEAFWDELEAFFFLQSGDSEAVKKSTYYAASLVRSFVFWGQLLRYGGAGEQRRVRLFHRDYFRWNDALVHEDVVPGNFGVLANVVENKLDDVCAQRQIFKLNGVVQHYSWKNADAWITTVVRYSNDYLNGESAQQKIQRDHFGFLTFFLRFLTEFVMRYFVRLGFLDGRAGFVFCFFMAFSQQYKIFKLYEAFLLRASPAQENKIERSF